jgi:hypothetical protein
MASGSRKQRAIRVSKLRPTRLAAQKLELVAEHHQLDVLHIRATATADEQATQSPNSEVEKRKEHVTDPRRPRPGQSTTGVMAAMIKR